MDQETLAVIREHIRANKEQYIAMGTVDKTGSEEHN
ncbi:hypothetical protein SAMN05216559_1808 [Halomicrobium zhouii]|uniref:Uncharacterized protein n=1 Tax=Halomicrobium zhouii TaxID=767519 RepID=A0A1I6L184_9EURY|nr:hypothetical protein SAMN05216559_1808 [Halomicrobium zhouii]